MYFVLALLGCWTQFASPKAYAITGNHAEYLDDKDSPKGTPSEQVAAIRERLDAARREYIKKLEKTTTTSERNQLMKEVPKPDAYAEQMLMVAEKYPTDPAALDALLWVIGNTPSGAPKSLNARAKQAIVTRHATSPLLMPFAVSLTWTASSGDEDTLRQLLKQNTVEQVQAALTYALARQLIIQAEMKDVFHIRIEVAPTPEATQQVKDSLDKDFGQETANRLRERTSQELREEARMLLDKALSRQQFRDAPWQPNSNGKTIGTLAQRDQNALQTLQPGKEAPVTIGTDLQGNKVSLSTFRGKVVLLTFSGHWCIACRNLYPLERELLGKHSEKLFSALTVNSDASRELAKKVVQDEKMTWPVIWDGGSTEGPLAQKWNVQSWPLVVLIDHHGIIRYQFRGAPVSAILFPLVEKLVREAKADERK